MDSMRLPSEIGLLKISANTYSSVAIASERVGGGEGESRASDEAVVSGR